MQLKSKLISQSLNTIKVNVEDNIINIPLNTFIFKDDIDWEAFNSSFYHSRLLAENFDMFIYSIIPEYCNVSIVKNNANGIIVLRKDTIKLNESILDLNVSEKNMKHAIGTKGRNLNFLKHVLINDWDMSNLKKIELTKKSISFFGEL